MKIVELLYATTLISVIYRLSDNSTHNISLDHIYPPLFAACQYLVSIKQKFDRLAIECRCSAPAGSALVPTATFLVRHDSRVCTPVYYTPFSYKLFVYSSFYFSYIRRDGMNHARSVDVLQPMWLPAIFVPIFVFKNQWFHVASVVTKKFCCVPVFFSGISRRIDKM